MFNPNSTWFCTKVTQLFAHFFGNFTTFVTLLLQIPKSFQITLRARKGPTLGPCWLPHSGSALGPSFRPRAARPSCDPCCSSHLQPRRKTKSILPLTKVKKVPLPCNSPCWYTSDTLRPHMVISTKYQELWYAYSQDYKEHLEILRVGVPRFLFGRNRHVGPQGVRGASGEEALRSQNPEPPTP